MMGEGAVTKWLNPATEREVTQRARDRANAARWDLNVAVFLFAVLIIILILLFQGSGLGIVAPVAIFGLAMAWLVGWRRGRQLYQHFYDEELAQYPDDWKDYYQILRVSPSAESGTISAAYERLAHTYYEVLSDEAKKIPLYSLMIQESHEAYQVLSNPVKRTAYDRMFWLKYNIIKVETEDSDRREIVDLAQSIAHEVRDMLEGKRWVNWRIPGWGKVTRRVVLGVVITLLAIFLGGTSLAFAKPGHALATPFRGVAITVVKTSSGAISLIEYIRGVVATHERSTVATALQTMRIEEGLEQVPPVAVSTNDMSGFPSREYSLFPDYLETRFSQFRYTVDSKGIVSVDTSWATTDAFLGKLKRLLERLEKRK